MAETTVATRPWDPRVHFEHARCYLREGKTVAARQEYIRGQCLGGDLNEVRVGVGITMLIEGRDEEAIDYLQPALDDGFGDAAAYLAPAYARIGDSDRSRELAASVNIPDNPEPWFWYAGGLLLACLNDVDNAITSCLSCLRTDERFSPARLLLGQMQERIGQIDEAQQLFEQFFLENPDNADAAYALAESLYKQDKHSEADQVLREAFRAGIQAPGLWELTGLLLISRRRFEKAIDIFKRIIEEPRFHAVAIQNIVYCHFSLGQFTEVMEFVKSLSDEDQDLPHCNYYRAEMLFRTQGPEAALPYFRRTAEQSPDNIEGRCAYIVMAMLAAQLRGVDMEGVPKLFEALQCDFPESGHVDLLMGRKAMLDGNTQQALTFFSKAVEKIPDHADAHYFKGEAMRLLSNGRGTREMYQEWQTAIKLIPNHRGAWLSLAICAAIGGGREKALETIERAVRAGCNRDDLMEALDQCQSS